MISVVYITYRAGGFDILLESLANQTFTDYELIVVDDYEDRNLSQMFQMEGIPLRWYGKSRPKKYPDAKYGVYTAVNTGISHSKGDKIIVLHDYTMLPKDALYEWNRVMTENPKMLVVGWGAEYNYNGRFNLAHYSVFDPPVNKALDDRFVWYHDWIPETFEMFYTGYPRSFIDAVGGEIDERCDLSLSSDYGWVRLKAGLLGYSLYVNPKLRVQVINHRVWSIGGEGLWSVVKK